MCHMMNIPNMCTIFRLAWYGIMQFLSLALTLSLNLSVKNYLWVSVYKKKKVDVACY
jgi:hypothetical protein